MRSYSPINWQILLALFSPNINKQSAVCVCVSKSRLEFFSIICRNVKFSMNEFQCICFCPSLSWSPPPPNLIEQNLLFELASFALAQSTHNLCTWTYIKSNIKTKQNGKCELMPEGKTNKQSARGRLIWIIETIGARWEDAIAKWDENWMCVPDNRNLRLDGRENHFSCLNEW